MASTAVSAQGTTISIGSGTGSAKTITAIALGFPTILTASAHGFGNGDVVTLSGLTGTNAATLNGQSVVVKNKTTNTFAFDIDTTGLTITASGTATPVTYTQIKNINTISGFDGTSAEIDKTNLDSTAKELGIGLPDSGQVSIDADSDDTDAGQSACRTAYQAQTVKPFKVVLPNGKTFSFNAYVKKMSTSLGVDALVKTAIDLRITGAYTLA
jgi:Lambda phage tail tube protein, TTP